MKKPPSQAYQASGVFHHIFGIVGHVVRFRPARYPALAILLAAAVTLGAVFAVAEAREGDGFSAETADNPQQMTSRVLVSNLGQTEHSNVLMAGSAFAQRFRTGSSSAGYDLTSIEIRLDAETIARDAPTVTLRSGSADGTEVATLSGASRVAIGRHNVAFSPETTVTLNASTNYWVVLHGSSSIRVNYTDSDNEDGTSADGWTIHNNGEWQRVAGSGSFGPTLSLTIMIRVNGTVKAVPNATGAPVITAPNVFRVPAVLSVDLSDIADPEGVTNIADTATYNWQRFDHSGSTLEMDAIGTDATYTLTDADAGKRIKVQVSFDDDGGNAEGPLTSAAAPATGSVAAAAECKVPNYVGGAVELWTGTVAVGYLDAGLFFSHGFSDTGNGSLDDTTFTADDTHTIILTTVATIGSAKQLQFGINTATALSTAEKRELVLHVCDTPFALRDADTLTNNAVNWSSIPASTGRTTAERTLYISRDQARPECHRGHGERRVAGHHLRRAAGRGREPGQHRLRG